MLEQELTPFIENVKRMPEGNTDAVLKEIQDRLPEVVQKLVDQRVAEIKQNMTKENEERIQEINVLSANVSDVLERREHLLNLEAEIKRCQEDERKKRLAKTEEYTMLVFSLAGTSVEDVEKVYDMSKLCRETPKAKAMAKTLSLMTVTSSIGKMCLQQAFVSSLMVSMVLPA